MKDRYNKFVFEDERGITFEASAEQGMTLEVSEEAGGVLKIRACKKVVDETPREAGNNSDIEAKNIATSFSDLPAVSAGEYAEKLSLYTDEDGNHAVIPPGWTVSGVKKENTVWGKNVSVVIYKLPKDNVEGINWTDEETVELLKRTYSQLVWCLVSMLDSDGKYFNEKFGRRNFMNDKFSEDEFHEDVDPEMRESVKLYGGFYISRYHISKSETSGKPQSVKGVKPWTNINYPNAREVAFSFEVNEVVKSFITSGAGFDSVMSWVRKTGTKSDEEISEDSTNWGNYWNSKNSARRVVETGSKEEYYACNIADIAGNVDEWTTEEYGGSCSVLRGGDYLNDGYYYPAAFRNYYNPNFDYYDSCFRAMLYIVAHH